MVRYAKQASYAHLIMLYLLGRQALDPGAPHQVEGQCGSSNSEQNERQPPEAVPEGIHFERALQPADEEAEVHERRDRVPDVGVHADAGGRAQ